jgi:WD40 repeat protein
MQSVFSPDGGMLATSADGPGTQNDSAAVMLWGMTTGKLLSSLKHPPPAWILGLAFSADGNLVATTATNGAYLWNLIGFGQTPNVPPSPSPSDPKTRTK